MLRFASLTLAFLFTVVGIIPAQDSTPAVADLMAQAAAAYQAKRYSESAALYSRILALEPGDGHADIEVALARSEALAGNRDAAFEALDHAVKDGCIDRKDAESETDLASLHADPRWQPLLERMTLLTLQQDARWGDAAFATPYAANIPDADKLAGLAELWAQARFGFANFWHVPQLDWDKSYREFIPKVLATRSTADYYRVLQSFYAQIQDGHSNVYPPGQLNISPLPLRTRLVEGHLLVLGARNPSFDLQGLHPGDEILTINGEPAIAWARQHVQPFVSASTPQDRDNRTFGNDLFRAPEGTSFAITTSTPSGAHASHTFTVPPFVASSSPAFELRILPRNIAYVALNGFGDNTAADEWDKHWPEISNADALILDLRENGGGNSTVGDHIMATLIDQPVPGELSQPTRWIATYRAWGNAETPLRLPLNTVKPDPARHFSGPAVLLISPRTFSAAEDMTVVFKQAHRGQIIGEPSGGSTGQPLFFKLPGGGAARVCTKHDSFADGSDFVGVGIQPDIPAHPARADIIAGRDPTLATAIHALAVHSPSRTGE